MAQSPNIGNLAGIWTYRSLLNDPDLSTAFNALEFGRANISIDDAPMGVFKGRIYGPGWSLDLNGSIGYWHAVAVRFQGKGVVAARNGVTTISVPRPPWPNGVAAAPLDVGSIVRTIPHSADNRTVSPAGVASFTQSEWISGTRAWPTSMC